MNNLLRYLVLSALGVLLATGAMAQRFPEYSIPMEYRTLTIDELFALTLQNSQQLKVARAGVEVARQRRLVTQTQRLPGLGTSLNLSYLGSPVVLSTSLEQLQKVDIPHFGVTFGTQASQVVFRGGAVRNSIAQAELNEQVASLNVDQNRADVKLLLIGNYLDMYQAYNQRAVYVRNVRQAELRVAQAKALIREGVITKNEGFRLELQLANLRLSIQELDNTLSTLNRQLIVTLGLPRTVMIRPDTMVGKEVNPVGNLSEYLAQAEQGNFGLNLERTNLLSLEKGVAIARADRLPALSLVGSSNLLRPVTSVAPAIDAYTRSWSAGVGISYNIASIYTARYTIGLAQAQAQQQREAVGLQAQNVEIETQAAFANNRQAHNRLATLTQAVELAQQNYRIVEKRYTNQLALITDILDATNARLDAELQLANARINVLYTYYQLQRALGNL
ncbi:MAG: TolC family protein [Janthinobacterium lividum]